MDKARNRWAWIPQHMPRVAAIIQRQRKEQGAEHVAACWQRGVVECAPGWFYAREGALAVGVPWDGIENEVQGALGAAGASVAMVWLRPKEGAPSGAN